MTLDTEWLKKAIEIVEQGIASKVEKDNVLVYKCGKVIRVDIKTY